MGQIGVRQSENYGAKSLRATRNETGASIIPNRSTRRRTASRTVRHIRINIYPPAVHSSRAALRHSGKLLARCTSLSKTVKGLVQHNAWPPRAQIWTTAEGAMMDPVTEQKEWIKARVGALMEGQRIKMYEEGDVGGEHRGEINDIRPFTNFHARRSVSRSRESGKKNSLTLKVLSALSAVSDARQRGEGSACSPKIQSPAELQDGKRAWPRHVALRISPSEN